MFFLNISGDPICSSGDPMQGCDPKIERLKKKKTALVSKWKFWGKTFTSELGLELLPDCVKGWENATSVKCTQHENTSVCVCVFLFVKEQRHLWDTQKYIVSTSEGRSLWSLV